MDFEMLEEIKDALMEFNLNDSDTVDVYMNTIYQWRDESREYQQQKQRAGEVANKLSKICVRVSQDIGFQKYFGNKDDGHYDYLRELEKDLLEVLGLLGVDHNTMVNGFVNKENGE